MVIIDVNDVELAELVEGVVGVISGHNQEIMGHVQGSECHSIRSFDRFLILWRYYINEKNLLNGLHYSHENKNYITSGSPSPSRLRTRPEPSFSGTHRTGSSLRSGSPLPPGTSASTTSSLPPAHSTPRTRPSFFCTSSLNPSTLCLSCPTFQANSNSFYATTLTPFSGRF